MKPKKLSVQFVRDTPIFTKHPSKLKFISYNYNQLNTSSFPFCLKKVYKDNNSKISISVDLSTYKCRFQLALGQRNCTLLVQACRAVI